MLDQLEIVIFDIAHYLNSREFRVSYVKSRNDINNHDIKHL